MGPNGSSSLFKEMVVISGPNANQQAASLELPENYWVTRVVDLALNQAAKPWFHQYLDLATGTICGGLFWENVFRGQICSLGYQLAFYWPQKPPQSEVKKITPLLISFGKNNSLNKHSLGFQTPGEEVLGPQKHT